MIESAVLRDPGLRIGERLSGAGILSGAPERPTASQPGQAHPLPDPAARPSSPFDRKDLVEIRGQERPLAPGASLAAGASDEEGGGAAEGGAGAGQGRRPAKAPSALAREALAAYGVPLPGFPAAFAPAPFPKTASWQGPGDRPDFERRARRLSEAFSARTPESALGRVLDLAA